MLSVIVIAMISGINNPMVAHPVNPMVGVHGGQSHVSQGDDNGYSSEPFASTLISAEFGGIVGTHPETIDSVDDVSVLVPAGACSADTVITISTIQKALAHRDSCLGIYDFGPDGIHFEKPVTITIPYEITGSDSGALPYWQDRLADPLSKEGITDIEDIHISSTLRALNFKITHFTYFYIFAGKISAKKKNSAPALDPIADRRINENQSLNIRVSATDPDKGKLTYSARNLPVGATFKGQAFHWTPNSDQAGDYQVTFVVSDGQIQGTKTVAIKVVNVNRSPVFDLLEDVRVNENIPLAIPVKATDPDKGKLTYTAKNLPLGARFNGQVFHWIPNSNQAGEYQVTFFASDGLAQDTKTVTITVANVNRSPVLDLLEKIQVNENIPLTIPIRATDPDKGKLIYLARNLPEGATFQGQAFHWVPTSEQAGEYQVTFIVSDGQSLDSKTVAITVANVNRSPVIDLLADIRVNENKLLTIPIKATDPDKGKLIYTAKNLPVGATFKGQVFHWTPSADQAGEYQVTFVASDGQALDSRTVTITVVNVNRSPVLDLLEDIRVNENKLLTIPIKATDPDKGKLIYTVKNLPGGATFKGQAFYWTPSADQSGKYQITFVASDGQAQDSKTVTITVSNVNRSPVLDLLEDIWVNENKPLTIPIKATDPDKGKLTCTAKNLPEGATFQGQVFHWIPTAEQAGEYQVTFVASDGQAQDTKTVNITVANVNRPPVLDLLEDVQVNENKPLTIPIKATDPDKGNLTYTAKNLPAGATFKGQAFHWTPSADQSGKYQITFVASDGQAQDTTTVNITVANVNRTPVLDLQETIQASENNRLTIPVKATDLDNDKLSYTVKNLPEGATFKGQSLHWTPNADQAGEYEVIFIASDGQAQDTKTVTVMVANVNRSPVLDLLESVRVSENKPLNIAIKATDPDKGALIYTAKNLPIGATFNGKVFHWIPTSDQAGVYQVTFIASDGLAQDNKTVTIKVANVNRVPVLDPLEGKQVDENGSLAFSVKAVDPDKDQITYTTLNLPAGASFQDQTFNWSPTHDQADTYQVTFIASDGQSQDSATIGIAVANVNRTPVLDPLEGKQVDEKSSLTFSVNAVDPDKDQVTYSAQDLPTGASFQDQTFAWSPTHDQADTYQVTFIASDGQGQDTTTIDIAVGNVNRAPVLDALEGRQVNESGSLTFIVNAVDPDGDQVIYAAQNLPTGASFQDQTFTWSPTHDQADTYQVTFIASDGQNQDTTTIDIVVGNVNRAPVLDALEGRQVNENGSLTFTVNAVDPDEDQIMYSAQDLPTGASFQEKTFAWSPTHDQADTYQVTFIASDGQNQDSATIDIAVGNVNRAPVLDTLEGRQVNENGSLTFSVNAVDPDENPIIYTAQDLPTGASFQDQTFTWSPTHDQADTYQVTFIASDGQNQDTTTIDIVVGNVNRAPVFDPLEGRQVNENSLLTFSVNAVDPDENPITYTVQDLPTGASFQEKTFTWRPTHVQADTYQVTFIASDGQNQDTTTIDIAVVNVNRAPVLDTLEGRQVNENGSLTFSVNAVDPDNDQITYAANKLPTGASFKDQTFAWSPTHDQANIYQVTFIASDGQNQDSVTIDIAVANINRAPVFDPLGDRSVTENTALAFSVIAEDVDGDIITYSVTEMPDGATLDGRAFSWTPDRSQRGIHQVVFMASDGQLEDSQTVSLSVEKTDVEPPYVVRCLPDPHAIQVAKNTFINLTIADDGEGVDAGSVSIRADNNLIYFGDTELYQGIYGDCHRLGTSASYSYQFQPNTLFGFDQKVVITVVASDRDHNTMDEYTYSFVTEMRSFGQNIQLHQDPSGQGYPATAADSKGNVWVTWHVGKEGERDIMAVRMNSLSHQFGNPIRITHADGDQCYPDIDIDANDQAYVVWQDNSRGHWDICGVTSVDGIEWSDIQRIADTDDNQMFPALAVDLQSPGRAYIACQGEQDGYQHICVITSDARFMNTEIRYITADHGAPVEPDIAVSDGNAYVVWTDMRNGNSDLYGASSGESWKNHALVNEASNQWSPAIALEQGSSVIHLVWTDDVSGNADIFYAHSDGIPATPLTGMNIIDDTTATDQLDPAVALSVSETGFNLFICWSDARSSSSYNTDSDLYFAELSQGSASTNVLIGDENTNTNQTNPVVGVDDVGHPFIIWTDDRDSDLSIYYAGNTYVKEPFESVLISTEQGGTVGTPPEEVGSIDDVSVIVPPGACSSDRVVTISEIENKPKLTTPCLGAYEFGPSSTEFEEAVTISIPYEKNEFDPPVRPYWFDHNSSTLSDQGITDVKDIKISDTLHMLTFKTTHFTPYYIVHAPKGGGGCSISPNGHCGILEYCLPYIGLVLLLAGLRVRDKLRPSNTKGNGSISI